jgi:hypothetical protein
MTASRAGRIWGLAAGATRLASGAVTGWQIPALATACSTLGWAEKTPGSR